MTTVAAVVLSLAVAPAAMAAPPGNPVEDPIPTEPQTMGLGLVLSDYATFPQSQPDPAPTDQRLQRRARINTIMEVPDASGRRAVPDLNGKLYFVRAGAAPTVYLDVAARFQPQFFSGRGLGQGFGYVTFHPDFRTNGLFYTVHSEESAQTSATPDWQQSGTFLHNVVSEWRATNPAANTFAGTHREVLRLGFGGQIHGIQEINFNPTARPGNADYGMLYLAVGDGGLGVRNTEPQNLGRPFGKLLRIDPRGTNSANRRYGIPAGNPFVGRAGALGELYAYGFRDPHRFSWDTATGRMYLGHIGEKTIEAIYEVRAGDNLGWSEREGNWVFDRAATNPCDRLYPLQPGDSGFTYPVAMYDHNPAAGWNCTDDVGVAIAGGFVYRGTAIPALQGKYIFGDLVDGRLYYTEASEMVRGAAPATVRRLHVFTAAGASVRMRDLSAPGAPGDPNRVDLRFGTDAAGELYVLAKSNGKIWKVTGARTFAAASAGSTTVANTMSPASWSPLTPSRWQLTGSEVVLAQAGTARPGPRRPHEYAILNAGPRFGAVDVTASVRIDTPVSVTNRDVIIVFGHQSDTQYYYAILATDNKTYPHNGIFKVNNADRERIDYQWNGRSRGANPSIPGTGWHQVRVKHLPATGEIAVYVDGAANPRMTAVDRTFQSGRVGFGSFDNIGRLRSFAVTGTPAA